MLPDLCSASMYNPLAPVSDSPIHMLLPSHVFPMMRTPRSVDDMADTSSSGGQNQPHIVAASSGSGCGVRGCDSFPTAKESDPDEQIEPLIRAEFAKLRQAAERWSGKGGGGKGRTLQPAAFEKVRWYTVLRMPDATVTTVSQALGLFGIK